MRLHIHQKTDRLTLPLPYWVYIDGHPIGVMRKDASIQLGNGTYSFGIWLVLRFWKWELRLGKETRIMMMSEDMRMEFWHSEPVWDTIFNIDLIVWILTMIIGIPSPWSIVYHVLSDGFFVLWLARLLRKRNEYLVIEESKI